MKILKINSKNLKEIVEITVEKIKRGKVVICPTDTVYGLICNAANEKAVGKIFKIKQRLKSKPLALFVKDIEIAKNLAVINKTQEKLLRKFWPGKITAVLASRGRASASWQRPVLCNKLLLSKSNTIGLRIPDYKLVNELLKKLNEPLAQTSANISGKPASTKIKEILGQFKNQKIKPGLLLDAGDLPKNKPSQVIDLTGKRAKIIRN